MIRMREWIDDKGYLRLDHDENYQLIEGGPSADDVTLQMDSWDIELACKMIVTGYNVNTKRCIEYGLKDCPDGSIGRDRANILITVMSRILTLAKAAIAIGILKEADTPTNWLAWAQSKGYNTDHLNLAVQAEPLTDAGAVGDIETEANPQLGRLKKQQAAILKSIAAKGFEPTALPDGEKATIKRICELDYSELFKRETAFDRAWKLGINTLWRMENHESYAHRGK